MPQFLILAHDYKDAEALNRRLSVREQHLQRMREERAKGNFVTGGAKLTADNKMYGSMLIVQLENEEAVRAWVKEDPYIKGNVWEHVEILPFKVADV